MKQEKKSANFILSLLFLSLFSIFISFNTKYYPEEIKLNNSISPGSSSKSSSRFNVLAIAESGGHHIEYSKAAKLWLSKLAADSNFIIDYISNTDSVSDEYLKKYKLFIQLDYPPYAWREKAVKSFVKYIEEGKGGWIGFHHATLLGEFDGYPMWQWFYHFMGSIRFKDYIADFASGDVEVEDAVHPIMRGVPKLFNIKKEEWYTYDKSSRPNVHVIASVNGSSYKPSSEKRMGDHPVIWTNKKFSARNAYIFMGHSPVLFEDENYKTIFRNAIFWAAGE